ncbi:MAG: tripartite tricarboxylate transporter substrate binding protein [Pseudomonadota bacterium]
MKSFNRRDFSLRLVGAAALAGGTLPLRALAQSYPAGPVKIIVPYPPGAATDTLARVMAQSLQQGLGSNFVVENRGGGGSQIGTKAIAAAGADGLTLGFIDTAFVINPGLFGSNLPYDTQKDFTPVSLMATAPLVLIAHSSVPAADIRQFLALAKAQAGKLNYGSAGVGSAPHLAGEQLRHAAAIDINHVPYRGGSTVLNDLISGHIQFGFTTVPTMIEHIRSGAVKAMAVTGNTRAAQLPQVPTMAEAGLGAVDASPLFGLIAPAKLPQVLLDRLAAVAGPSVSGGPLNARLKEMGFIPAGSSPEEFRMRIDSEIKKWSAVIKAGNIKPNA